jgi:signal transduction histidine kinase
MRALIIEDEPKTAAFLCEALREAGWSLDVARDGQEGLQKALAGDYAFILLDIMLPDRDGWSVLSALRENGKATPVLCLTARDAVGDRVRGLDLGAARKNSAYYARLLGPDGAVKLASAEADALLPPSPRFAAAVPVGHALGETALWRREGHTLLLTSALAQAFDRMLERLEESFERLSQFSADLAHEFRTPLHNLPGEAQWALVKPRAAEDYRRVVQSGMEGCERLARTVDGMLFLARADHASILLRWTEICVPEVVRELLNFFEPWANERGVTLRAQGDAKLQADPDLFRRLLSNLTANAVEHTPSGGQVEVLCEDGGTAVHVALPKDFGTSCRPTV